MLRLRFVQRLVHHQRYGPKMRVVFIPAFDQFQPGLVIGYEQQADNHPGLPVHGPPSVPCLGSEPGFCRGADGSDLRIPEGHGDGAE